MSKKLFSILSVILAAVLMLSISNFAFADNDAGKDEIIGDRYTTISNVTTNCYISGATIHCAGTVNAKYDTTIKIKLELQKKKSGSFETIKTWSGSKANTRSYSLSGSRAINLLATYRLKATYTAGSETITVYKNP